MTEMNQRFDTVIFKDFENKIVKVVRKSNKFFYKGFCKKISPEGVLIEDRKDGLMFIPGDDVYEMKEVRENGLQKERRYRKDREEGRVHRNDQTHPCPTRKLPVLKP